MGGDKCDRCARGYVGDRVPHCQPCGECFDNWDRILTELRAQTEQVVTAAGQIRETGATGAYTREFELMETKLTEVRKNTLITFTAFKLNMRNIFPVLNS